MSLTLLYLASIANVCSLVSTRFRMVLLAHCPLYKRCARMMVSPMIMLRILGINLTIPRCAVPSKLGSKFLP
ncbi:hypothetical protein BDZ91DRAFT_713973 [Kalaharituber pfeilii]|nr:hypothetical protein BDZ91DRAFT_713973 [Kalaharituber pfeilii]